MARKAILDTYYTFTPSTRTVVIPRAIPRERLILITDVTTNQVIYNFSDATLKATAYTIGTDAMGITTTTIVLNYNTAALSSTDKLQIVIDEYAEKFSPSEELTDPVNKLRISSPQALIDTDFEYSAQSTKWESIALINNNPYAYYNAISPITLTNLSAVTNSRTITANTTTPPAIGSPVYIQDSNWGPADGLYTVDSNTASTSFTYTARIPYTGTSGTIYNSSQTTAYNGSPYSNANIAISSITNTAGNVQIVTTGPHGLSLGNEIALTGAAASTFAPNGSWVVSTVGNANAFSIYPVNGPTGSITGGTLYTRPQGQVLHRAFDGGVQFSTFAQSHNQQLIRQTRRYFRYQSGKGIQMSTGTVLKPNFQVDSITSSATTVTVVSKVPHNLNPGVSITTVGCNEQAYNGTFVVTTVLDPYRFQYTAASTPSATTATGQYQMSVSSWYGAATRVGMFDTQNGIFFEFDGTTLYAVRRTSTYQLSGWITATNGSNTVTGVSQNGVNTVFTKQLLPNDFIVIKGMSYRIVNIASDTSMTIYPAYRGTTVTQAIASKTIEYRVPQSQWNIDRCDGTGPSGYNIDLTKMQMFYMDYSWYGAGFIRWGFRASTGDVVYCHKMINNNLNYEAYMRSGNLPGRYETNTFSKYTILTQSMSSANTTMYVADTTGWPSTGIAVVRNASQQEYVNYTGKSQDASLTFTLASGSTTVTGTSTTGVVVGAYVMGTGIQPGTTIQSIVTNTSMVLSLPATFSGTQTLTINPTLTGLTRAQTGGNLTIVTTANSAVATAASTSGVQIGQLVISPNIAPGTSVNTFVTSTSVTLSQAALISGTGVATFAPMGNTVAQTFTYSSTAPVAVELHSPSFAPSVSHWGTSVIMDGRFDDDKAFVFTRGMTSQLAIASGATNALMSFRIAPSVSNGITASTLGTREIVNRMQMVLRQMDVLTNGQFLIQLQLNGVVSNASPNWTSVGGSSLAQYINHSTTTTLTGGETIFGFYLNTGAGGTNYQSTQQDLLLVRDMGTSILSGGSALGNINIYPDGPDVVTVLAQNIGGATANVFARMSWTEAQA